MGPGIVAVGFETALCRPIDTQRPALLHQPLIDADGFAHDRAIADMPLAVSAVGTPVGATHLAFAEVFFQTVTGLDAACPGGAFVVEAGLVGLRRFDAVQPVND